MNISKLYEKDFYAWTVEMAQALKSKAIDQLDFEHLSEELEDMGASQERELESRLAILIMHLLKWEYQPTYQSKSWSLTIKEQRRKIQRRLSKTPSLKSKVNNMLDDVYGDALLSAQKETGLDESVFPKKLPYSLKELLDDNFYSKSSNKS